MLQRVGISMNDRELKHLSLLQKRLGARSRSELLREIVKRYEKLEADSKALSLCLDGYLEHPESGGAESRAILRGALKNRALEDWA